MGKQHLKQNDRIRLVWGGVEVVEGDLNGFYMEGQDLMISIQTEKFGEQVRQVGTADIEVL